MNWKSSRNFVTGLTDQDKVFEEIATCRVSYLLVLIQMKKKIVWEYAKYVVHVKDQANAIELST